MLGTKAELKKTRFYKEIEEETHEAVLMKAIPALLEAGMSTSEIAKRLEISVKQVKAIAASLNIKV